MVYACQKNSFLKEFSSNVISCTEASIESNVNGGKQTIPGYEVVLEDTILFPEGGGQPCDFGLLDDVQVLQVVRRGAEAVHFVKSPIEVGKTVKQTVDWPRRLDHMQHHSGQHLITALAYSMFGYETTSWWLGEDICHIELATPSMKQSEIDALEKKTNETIREGLSVTVDVYSRDDPILNEVRTRGLPEDVAGGIRVVTIEGIESDMCCGTHVTNTSQLQVVKLFNAEKGKKGKVNLQFLVGERVVKKLAVMFEREQKLTAILNNGPDWHVDLVSKAQKSLKALNKSLQNFWKEFAKSEAKVLKNQDPQPKYYSYHWKDAEPDIMNIFINELNGSGIVLFLTAGDEKGSGHMALVGPEDLLANVGDEICQLLDGKGAAKGNRYSGKVKNLKNRSKAEKLVAEAVKQA